MQIAQDPRDFRRDISKNRFGPAPRASPARARALGWRRARFSSAYPNKTRPPLTRPGGPAIIKGMALLPANPANPFPLRKNDQPGHVDRAGRGVGGLGLGRLHLQHDCRLQRRLRERRAGRRLQHRHRHAGRSPQGSRRPAPEAAAQAASTSSSGLGMVGGASGMQFGYASPPPGSASGPGKLGPNKGGKVDEGAVMGKIMNSNPNLQNAEQNPGGAIGRQIGDTPFYRYR